MKLDWEHWLYGLGAALIGGGAGSITSVFGASYLAPGQFGLGGVQGWNSLKLMVLSFAINGAISAFAYLKQSPLPAPEIVVETKTEPSPSTQTTTTTIKNP
jgi:hypothetical protein